MLTKRVGEICTLQSNFAHLCDKYFFDKANQSYAKISYLSLVNEEKSSAPLPNCDSNASLISGSVGFPEEYTDCTVNITPGPILLFSFFLVLNCLTNLAAIILIILKLPTL